MRAVATRPEERDGTVERLAGEYGDSAGDYARYWAPVLRPFSVGLLEELPLGSADRVVDVGTGTGDLLPRLRERAPGAEVIGVDRSRGMAAEGVAGGRGPVATMDARSLALAAGVADVVTLAFVLFHVPRPAEALAELRRVLAPGGTLGLVTWSRESPPLPGEEAWHEELDRAGAGPDPRPGAVRRYEETGEPARLVRLLGEAGFPFARCSTHTFVRRWEPEALFEVLARFGATGRRLATLPRAERSPCLSRMRRRTRDLSEEELVWRPRVVYGVGRIPDGRGGRP